MDTIEHRRREELAAYLRTRRDRLTPDEVGIASNGKRRTPGLRREEVAMLAGVSSTWYTWLEQARPIRVSRQVLHSLARALQLESAEEAHLFQLSGEVPPGTESDEPKLVSMQHQALLDALYPSPALITNRRFDVLAWNRALPVLFEGFDELAPGERNTLWMTFRAPQVRELYGEDWAEVAAYTVSLFRSQASDLLARPEFDELVTELTRVSAEFRELWNRREITSFAPVRRPFRHSVLGLFELDHVKMYAADDDRTLVAYLFPPTDPTLAARIDELARARRDW